MANNIVQVKRTNVSGRTPNTTGSYVTNSQYISAGELALNMADGILYSSNGSAVIEVGANNTNQRITNSITIDNDRNLYFKTVNTSATVGFRQQNDDNFVFYSTNATYGQRAVWAIFANSDTSALSILTPVTFNGNVNQIVANGTLGSPGQVLATNGSGIYWTTTGGTGTVTSVGSANGIAGGPITGTGTLYAVAGNSTVFVNASGIHVNTASLPSGSVNVDAQYTWTNTHIFQNTITFNANIGDIKTGSIELPYGNFIYELFGINAKLNGNTNTEQFKVVANTDNVVFTVTGAGNVIFTAGISANGSYGTANQVLTTNGSVAYWADAAGGSSVYMKGGSATVGSLAVEGQNIFRVNANTLNNNTTIATGENAQATGPLAVASGITLTVESGARVAIV